MVERFHRQLKSSLKCHLLAAGTAWTTALPVVLLGLRSAVKLDSQFSAAQMLYGVPLRLPGDFFAEQPLEAPDPADFVSRVRQQMRHFWFPPFRQRTSPVHVDKNLFTCSHVFIRRDAHRTPLQAPYDGPFPVLERHDKYFVLQLQRRKDSVSIDRLKPAFLELEPFGAS